jgi:hypothetical protein
LTICHSAGSRVTSLGDISIARGRTDRILRTGLWTPVCLTPLKRATYPEIACRLKDYSPRDG